MAERIASMEDHVSARILKGPGCWPWTGALSAGRPIIPLPGSRNQYVRRYLWEREHGPIAEGMTIRKQCSGELCVRLDHFTLSPLKLIGTQAIPTYKRCRTCQETKPAGEFQPKTQKSDGLESWCRLCSRERQRDYNLSKYGIGQDTYARFLAQQDGGCAICGGPEGTGRPNFHIDHDHVTGAIRGLLCHHCNLALGQARDQPDVLRAMVGYLADYPALAYVAPRSATPSQSSSDESDEFELEAPQAVPPGYRRCRGCRAIKTTSEFPSRWRSKGRHDLDARCRPCVVVRNRIQNVSRRFGQQANQIHTFLLEHQGHRCAVCKTPESASRERLYIDHDHATGQIRGLLCHRCNLALGHAKDDPARLHALADYLEGSP